MAPFFLLEEFMQYLTSEKRFSEHTRVAYRRDIEQFLEFSGASTQKDIQEIDSRLVRGWMVEMLESEYTSTSVNRKLSSLRTYFKWLLKEGKVSVNPLQLVNGPKNNKKLPSFAQKKELTQERIDLLFEEDFDGQRDRVMFEVLYQTGVRSSELVNLKDVDVQSDRMKVLGKRNKERFIPISRELYQIIENYRVFEA